MTCMELEKPVGRQLHTKLLACRQGQAVSIVSEPLGSTGAGPIQRGNTDKHS